MAFGLLLTVLGVGCHRPCDAEDPLVASYWVDNGDDDTIDRLYVYTYDAAGNVVTEEQSGEGQWRYTSTYDDNDCLISRVGDEALDGTIDTALTYDCDTAGNHTTVYTDFDGDGTWENRDTYTYDAHGNVLSEESYSTETDSVYFSVTFTYDSHDNMVESCVDGNPRCETITYTYDPDGNKLTECDDADRCYAYEYKDGSLAKATYEDGSLLSTFLYDACASLSTFASTEAADQDGDGASDLLTSENGSYTYDDRGSLVYEERTSTVEDSLYGNTTTNSFVTRYGYTYE